MNIILDKIERDKETGKEKKRQTQPEQPEKQR